MYWRKDHVYYLTTLDEGLLRITHSLAPWEIVVSAAAIEENNIDLIKLCFHQDQQTFHNSQTLKRECSRSVIRKVHFHRIWNSTSGAYDLTEGPGGTITMLPLITTNKATGSLGISAGLTEWINYYFLSSFILTLVHWLRDHPEIVSPMYHPGRSYKSQLCRTHEWSRIRK
jgi:hypothetical protein